MIISSIHDLLSESISPSVGKAKSILVSSKMNEKEAHKLALVMSSKDPYTDKRFTPILASWFTKKLPWEEHVNDIKEYKELRHKVKSLRINVKEQKDKLKLQKDLLELKPEDFQNHYSDLGKWISKAKDLLDLKQYSDKGLEIVGEIKDGEFRYVMYKLNKKSQCSIPIIKSMTYCITKDHFGYYGKPPYYPVVRYDQSGVGEQFAMIIPNYLKDDDEEAVRNAKNTGRLSSSNRKKIEPLIKMVVSKDDQSDYAQYILYKNKKIELPNKPTARIAHELFKKYDFEPNEWPEGEDSISKSAHYSYLYAQDVLNGPFPKGEEAISKNEEFSYLYAKDVLKGPFPKGENAISEDAHYSYAYARDVLNGPFHKGENTISKDAHYSYNYAKYVLNGRFTKCEEAISKDAGYSYLYAKYVFNGPFAKGEKEISKYPPYSYKYAKDVLKGPFPKGEKTLKEDKLYWKEYIKFLKSKGIKIE